MKTTLTILLASMALSASASLVQADTEDRGSKTDRKVYSRLIQEIRRAHVELARAYKRGVDEARANNGTASTRTRAKIVSLRDEIDRKNVRLMLVADRHGWEVPEFRLEDFEKEAQEPVNTDLTDQFFPPDPRITNVLSDEAKALAGRVRLPIIPAASKVKVPRDDD
jgi:hypothetical protein